jgi:hypothetical protein
LDPETIGKVADATKAMAETGGKAIDASASFGRVIKGPIEDLIGIVQDRVKFVRWERQLALIDKAETIMKARSLSNPTRELPLNFAVPLLTAAVLEEDDELQRTWARLLVNAGDAATEMELRTAYVEILRGMSALDVKVLARLCEATLGIPPGAARAIDVGLVFFGGKSGPQGANLPVHLGISLANLARLGCALPGGGFDAAVIFGFMTVTDLGIGLYKACSDDPKRQSSAE